MPTGWDRIVVSSSTVPYLSSKYRFAVAQSRPVMVDQIWIYVADKQRHLAATNPTFSGVFPRQSMTCGGNVSEHPLDKRAIARGKKRRV